MEDKAEIDAMTEWLSSGRASRLGAPKPDDDTVKARVSFFRQGIQTGYLQLD